jgi:hypothetical protein
MTESGFACLQRAVNLARDQQIKSLTILTATLEQEKWTKNEIDEAISAWTDYENNADRGRKRRIPEQT